MNMNKVYKNMVIVGVIVACGLSAFAADDAGYALLLQSSPADGGNILPGSGVHKVQIGDKMQLAAVPRSGYRFLYWVGDVGQIGTSETTVEMDSPKMVIAVFAREQFEDLKSAGVIGGQAAGGTYASSSPGAGSRGYGTAIDRSGYDYIIPQTPTDDNETLVPEVPEPTTLLLFASGAIALARRQKRTQL